MRREEKIRKGERVKREQARRREQRFCPSLVPVPAYKSILPVDMTQ